VAREIDVMHLGRDRVICAHEIDGLIVDPGPASCLDTLLAGLDEGEPRALLLTHVHLDHAGAAGSLVRRFPNLAVYVHERGAPHLADPSKLLASAAKLYGDDMERLWGEVVPVPRENLRTLAGGEAVEGFRVAYAPGHASHHVVYLHEDSGDCYTGDVAGVRVPPAEYTLAPTPPPDIDLDAWLRSLETVEAWAPASLRLTHFGRVADVSEQLERVRVGLRRNAERARGEGLDSFVSEIEAEVREAVDPDTAASVLQAAPPDQLFLGLERYWSKRLAPSGLTPAASRPDSAAEAG
jgi:glyoxylase-like metal-dependent hydrolase (beta-lactamase superfamily II)